jgi:phthiocerol/phenolphthiocerol synthesis type-I polyketide synthase E
LTALSREDVEAQMSPKVDGFYALSSVLAHREPDFGVLFSSNASVLGGFGYAAYAAANAFLDHSVHAPLNDHFQWLCTNWDRWITDAPLESDVSDAERYTIRTEAGLDALWTIIAQSPAPQVIVATASLPERLERWVARRQRGNGTLAKTSSPRPGHVAPRTNLEGTIVRIWQDVLGCADIGVEDSFFDLGGDSLIALRILTRVRELYGVQLSLKALLGSRPTVASLVLQLVTGLQQERRPTSTSVS